jgi:hypothetical protein
MYLTMGKFGQGMQKIWIPTPAWGELGKNAPAAFLTAGRGMSTRWKVAHCYERFHLMDDV